MFSVTLRNQRSFLITLLMAFVSGIFTVNHSFADSPTGMYFSGYQQSCSELKVRTEANEVSCNQLTLKKVKADLKALLTKLTKHAHKDQVKYIKEMQSAWVSLKKAQCGLVKTYYSKVNYEKWTSQCEAAMTIKRVEELRELGTGILWDAY